MAESISTVLTEWSRNVIDRIRENLDSTKTTASGKTKKSLTYEVMRREGYHILIEGRPFFQSVETGRGPTIHPQHIDLVSILAQWIRDKGLDTTWNLNDEREIRSVAYAIMVTHRERGSKLYRDGGRTDIYSNVIAEELPELKQGLATAVVNDIRDNTVRKMVAQVNAAKSK